MEATLRHDLDGAWYHPLYIWYSNNQKASITLEELGLPYRVKIIQTPQAKMYRKRNGSSEPILMGGYLPRQMANRKESISFNLRL